MLFWISLYIDPGQGSIVLQLVIAAVTGLAFYITLARKRIYGFLKRIFGKKGNTE